MATIDTYVTVGGKSTITKDPQADLDYTWNWAPYLAGISDSIATVQFVIEGPDNAMTQHDAGFSGALAVVWLAGGTVGNTYRVTCRITTTHSPQRVDDRSIFVKVTPR